MEKNKGTLYLNMILKDTEPVDMVKRSIDSVKDYVDAIYITVTYNETKPNETSDLVKLLNSYKAAVSFFKWTKSFSEARNFAMDKVPKGENKFIYWQDADDVLVGGEHFSSMLEEAVKLHHAAIFLDYWYAVDLDKAGNVREIIVQHKRERIIRNDDTFKWIGSLHELLIEQRQENVQKIFSPQLADIVYVIHLTNKERTDANLDRNVEILETQAKNEQHRDPRTLVYLGKGYYDRALDQTEEIKRNEWLDKALKLFDEYLQGSGKFATKEYREGSGWPEERANTWQFVSEIFRLKGDIDSAIDANQQAIDEAPAFPIYFIERSLLYCQKEDFKKAKVYLGIATMLKDPKTTIITTPRDLKIKALEADVRIALHEHRLEHARLSLEKMFEIMPGNKDIEDRLNTVSSIEAANKASQSIVFLGKYLEQIKEDTKIVPLLQAVPNHLRTEKFFSEMSHKFIPPRNWGSNEIAILCGPGFEQWTPKSIEKGIGGSEEAVIYLSQELTKLGWKVTVYANPMDEAGDFDGVIYKQWYDININDSFNVLVLWRSIGMADYDLKSKFTMVWMHDVPNNTEFIEKRLNKVNKVAVLSEYHKSLFRQYKDGALQKIPDDKFFLTGNGITDMKLTTWNGDPTRMCYVSSPDRGLEYLLVNWKKIKEAVPEAKLDVCYGFKLFEAFYRDNPAKMGWMKKMMDFMKQDGITYHGRISHDKLHELMNKCGIWAYPTDFDEISCISAMKSQALGAIPVTTNHAALKETIRNGIKVDVDIVDEDGQADYIKALTDLLKDPKKQEEIRKGMMEFAKERYGWSKIAKQWDGLFKLSTTGSLLEQAASISLVNNK